MYTCSTAFGAVAGVAAALHAVGAVGLGIVVTVVTRSFVGRMDARLFARFDHRALTPIHRATGMLAFCLPEQGAQRDAWERLRCWVMMDMPSAGAPGPLSADSAFAWTALLGPSGVGKSQLCRELARHLAQRERYGDAVTGNGFRARVVRFRAQAMRSLHRLLPFISSEEAPFDVGLVACDDRGEGSAGTALALAQFRPRAPTLMLLDTPGLGVARQVIATLRAAAAEYRHPVRLLLIDEAIGLDWPLVPRVDGSFAYPDCARKFEPIVLSLAGFDLPWFALAVRRRWHHPPGQRPVLRTSQDVAVLRRPEELNALHGMLGADPVRLSLAVHWLADDASRSVAQLSQAALEDRLGNGEREDRSLAEHASASMAADLAEGLHVALRALEGPDAAGGLGCALACATLGHGLPLTRQVCTLFAVGGRRERYRDWLRSRSADSALWLPALSPRPLAEAFVERVRQREFSRSPELFLRQVVQGALDLRPAGTLKTLVRGGSMARAVVSALSSKPEPAAPGLHLIHFYGAAAAALAGEEALLMRAQCLAATMDESQLGRAVTSLERARFCCRAVQPLALGAVYAALAQRILTAGEVQEEAYRATLACMRRWLHAVSGNALLHYTSEHTTKLLLDALAQLVRTYLSWTQEDRCPSTFEALRVLDEELMSRLPPELLQHLCGVADRALVAGQRPSLLSAWVSLWRVRAAAGAARVLPTEQALRGLSRELSEAPLSLRQTLLLRMKSQLVWVELLSAIQASSKIEGALAEVEVMAELFAAAPAAYPELTLERARALSALAGHRRRSGQGAARVDEVVQEVERLIHGFSSEAPTFCDLMLNLAKVRCHAAAVHATNSAQRARTIDHVEGVIRITAYFSPGHALYPELSAVAVQAWTHASVARHGEDSYWQFLPVAARMVARLLSPLKATPWAYPQLMVDWASLFIELPALPAGSASAAAIEAVEACSRKVERIMKPFLNRPLIFPEAVERQVAGLGQVVAVRAAGDPAGPALDRTLAKMLGYLQPFADRGIDHPQVRLALVRGLRHATQGRACVPELQERVEPALKQIGRLVKESGTGPVTSPELLQEWALAGASLSYVGGQQGAGTRIAELGARVVQRAIERLGGPALAGEALVQLWIEALQWVAVACSREPGQRGHALQAAQQMDRIAAMPYGVRIDTHVLPRARAWAAVAAARRFVTEQRLRTEDAAWKVEALAEARSAAWESNVELMQLWARAWGDVAWACGAVPDQTARAAKAAARMRYVVTEFARDCYQELLDVERMLAELPGYDEGRLVRSSGVVSRASPREEEDSAVVGSRLDCA